MPGFPANAQAIKGSAGMALSLQMGNSPAMISKHSRERVKPKDAERYRQIKPGAVSEKVVSFSG